MFAVGHLAFAYVAGKLAATFLGVEPDLPLLFMLSVLQDIDFLLPGIHHREVTHSIVVVTFVFLLLYVVLKRKVLLPYFVATAQHCLGDILTPGRLQLYWPLSSNRVGLRLPLPYDLMMEWVLFLTALIILIASGDLRHLSTWRITTPLLLIPITAIILPLFFGYPLYPPLELALPHAIFLAILTLLPISSLRKTCVTEGTNSR